MTVAQQARGQGRISGSPITVEVATATETVRSLLPGVYAAARHAQAHVNLAQGHLDMAEECAREATDT